MLARTAKWALGPLLLWQGQRVRRTTVQLPEPRGSRSGGQGALRLLVVGDSSAAGVGVECFERTLAGQLVGLLGGPAAVSWTVVAKTGWTTEDATRALAPVPGPFDLAVTALGVNDVTRGLPPGAAQDAHRALIRRLQQDLGASRIVVTTLPPIGRFPALPQPLRWYLGRRAREYDRALEDLARELNGVTRVQPSLSRRQIDMADDGFHPGPSVYVEWAQRIVTALDLDPSGATAATGDHGP